MRGFAFPRQFRQSTLAESLSRNMRELITFLNSFVVRFDDDGETLTLPGAATVGGVLSADGGIEVEAWLTPALGASWVNFDVVDETPIRYRKDPTGIVLVQGVIKDGTVTSGTVLFTLPAGYRPSHGLHLPMVSNNAFASVKVQPDGGVVIRSGWNAAFASLNLAFPAA